MNDNNIKDSLNPLDEIHSLLKKDVGNYNNKINEELKEEENIIAKSTKEKSSKKIKKQKKKKKRKYNKLRISILIIFILIIISICFAISYYFTKKANTESIKVYNYMNRIEKKENQKLTKLLEKIETNTQNEEKITILQKKRIKEKYNDLEIQKNNLEIAKKNLKKLNDDEKINVKVFNDSKKISNKNDIKILNTIKYRTNDLKLSFDKKYDEINTNLELLINSNNKIKVSGDDKMEIKNQDYLDDNLNFKETILDILKKEILKYPLLFNVENPNDIKIKEKENYKTIINSTTDVSYVLLKDDQDTIDISEISKKIIHGEKLYYLLYRNVIIIFKNNDNEKEIKEKLSKLLSAPEIKNKNIEELPNIEQ